MSHPHHSAPRSAPPSDGDAAELLLTELASALHEAGVPAHRLEDALATVGRVLDREAAIFSTPTSVMLAFAPGRTTLLRVTPAPVALGHMGALDGLVAKLAKAEISVDEARSEIARLRRDPPRHGRATVIASFAVASGASAVFLGGSSVDVVVSVFLGAITGVISSAFVAIERARATELAAAVVVSASAQLLARPLLGMSAALSTLAGLIVLLPGLTLTTAMNELASRHLVSGTARLMSATMTFLQLALGVSLGEQLAKLVVAPVTRAATVPLGEWTTWVAIVCMAMAALHLFHADRKAAPEIIVGSALAFFGARFGAHALGAELGAFLGAFLIGVFANAHARMRGTPSSMTLVPAVLMLVPGSLGYRSLEHLVEKDTLAGLETGVSMVFVAVSIVAGLLASSALVPSHRPL